MRKREETMKLSEARRAADERKREEAQRKQFEAKRAREENMVSSICRR
jgi:hypothetical protein